VQFATSDLGGPGGYLDLKKSVGECMDVLSGDVMEVFGDACSCTRQIAKCRVAVRL
jgi:hypothetical protein